MATLDARSMIGRIYVGYHQLLLQTKYKSSGPHDLREDFFYILQFPIVRLWEMMTARAWPICMTMGDDDRQGVANLDPRGMIGRIYVRNAFM